ncbi:MAG: glycosyltransferase family 39 protein [Actinobacteria bacterium]|nr:glycosyltransferase family 39 protein [Actinomycetota bacterium]
MTDRNRTTEPETAVSHRSWAILTALVLLALAIRMAAVSFRPMLQGDEAIYIRMAGNLASDSGALGLMEYMDLFFPPLYSWMMAGLDQILGDMILSGHAVAVIFGSLVPIPVFLLGRALLSERTGLMAAALITLNPLLVDTSSRLFGTGVFLFFLTFGMYFTWKLITGFHRIDGIMAGASMGFAYLAGEEALYYMSILVPLSLAVAWQRRAWNRLAVPALAAVAVFMLFAVPYALYLHQVQGGWSLTGGSSTPEAMAVEHLLKPDTVAWDRYAYGFDAGSEQLRLENYLESKGPTGPLRFFLEDPWGGFKRFFSMGYDFHAEEMAKLIPLTLLPLLGLGLFARGWDRRRAARTGFLWLMISPAFIGFMLYFQSYFFIEYLPPLMVLAAMGWRRLEQWGAATAEYCFSGSLRERLTSWSPLLLAMVVMLPLLALSGVTVLKQRYPVEKLDSANWITATAGEGKRIMDREPATAIYAGAEGVILPYADYNSTTDYALRADVDYLVISVVDVRDWRPELGPLLEGEDRHPEWTLVNTVRPGTDKETLIFELKRNG